ncbi:MAG: radical SAM protein [Desulfomonilaceae bacterium]|nr:radical SAM protein [Desulfomonilaceae bacterium]
MLKTVLRMEYRHRVGIGLDRRFRPGRSAPPTNMSLCLSMRCNLNCIMCRQNRHTENVPENRSWFSKDRELPLEAWVSILDQSIAFRPWLFVTGGEPILYPHFREFIEAAKKRRFVVHLQTNGTLLAKEAEFLVGMGLEAVTISLDGTPEIHDRIRGRKGTFGLVEKGVRTLVEARLRAGGPGPILSFNFTISKQNLECLERIVPLAADLGADMLQIQHTMFNTEENVARHNRIFADGMSRRLGVEIAEPSISDDEYYRSEVEPEDVRDLISGLHSARRQAKGRIRVHFMPNLPHESIRPYYLDLDHPFYQACDTFWKTFRILADGTFSPCLNFLVGNITQRPLMDLWNGPEMSNLRKLFSGKLYPGCARCCQRHYLRGSRAF